MDSKSNSSFLQELEGSSLTPNTAEALKKEFEEWLTEAIDDWAKQECEAIKEEILQKARAGEFKTEYGRKVIEEKRGCGCYSPRSCVKEKLLQNAKKWETAKLLSHKSGEIFPYRNLFDPMNGCYTCITMRLHAYSRPESVRRTYTKTVQGLFRTKEVEESYYQDVPLATLGKWGIAFCEALKKQAAVDKIKINFVDSCYKVPYDSDYRALLKDTSFYQGYERAWGVAIQYRVEY